MPLIVNEISVYGITLMGCKQLFYLGLVSALSDMKYTKKLGFRLRYYKGEELCGISPSLISYII